MAQQIDRFIDKFLVLRPTLGADLERFDNNPLEILDTLKPVVWYRDDGDASEPGPAGRYEISSIDLHKRAQRGSLTADDIERARQALWRELIGLLVVGMVLGWTPLLSGSGWAWAVAFAGGILIAVYLAAWHVRKAASSKDARLQQTATVSHFFGHLGLFLLYFVSHGIASVTLIFGGETWLVVSALISAIAVGAVAAPWIHWRKDARAFSALGVNLALRKESSVVSPWNEKLERWQIVEVERGRRKGTFVSDFLWTLVLAIPWFVFFAAILSMVFPLGASLVGSCALLGGVLISIALHELGHAQAIRWINRTGGPPSPLRIRRMETHVLWSRTMDKRWQNPHVSFWPAYDLAFRPSERIAIVQAGPLATLFLAVIILVPLFAVESEYARLIVLGLFGFNALTFLNNYVFPLGRSQDGARIRQFRSSQKITERFKHVFRLPGTEPIAFDYAAHEFFRIGRDVYVFSEEAGTNVGGKGGDIDVFLFYSTAVSETQFPVPIWVTGERAVGAAGNRSIVVDKKTYRLHRILDFPQALLPPGSRAVAAPIALPAMRPEALVRSEVFFRRIFFSLAHYRESLERATRSDPADDPGALARVLGEAAASMEEMIRQFDAAQAAFERTPASAANGVAELYRVVRTALRFEEFAQWRSRPPPAFVRHLLSTDWVARVRDLEDELDRIDESSRDFMGELPRWLSQPTRVTESEPASTVWDLPLARRWSRALVFSQPEILFAWLIPAAFALFPHSSWIGWFAWALQAALFAAWHLYRHGDRLTWAQTIAHGPVWILIGLGLGLPFVVGGGSFWWNSGVSALSHIGYNLIPLLLHAFVPSARRFIERWVPLASSSPSDAAPPVVTVFVKGTGRNPASDIVAALEPVASSEDRATQDAKLAFVYAPFSENDRELIVEGLGLSPLIPHEEIRSMLNKRGSVREISFTSGTWGAAEEALLIYLKEPLTLGHPLQASRLDALVVHPAHPHVRFASARLSKNFLDMLSGLRRGDRLSRDQIDAFAAQLAGYLSDKLAWVNRPHVFASEETVRDGVELIDAPSEWRDRLVSHAEAEERMAEHERAMDESARRKFVRDFRETLLRRQEGLQRRVETALQESQEWIGLAGERKLWDTFSSLNADGLIGKVTGTGSLSAARAEAARQASGIDRWEKELLEMVEHFPSWRVNETDLPSVVDHLLDLYPELAGPLVLAESSADARQMSAARIVALLSDPEVANAGWTPRRLAQHAQAMRDAASDLEKRFPRVPTLSFFMPVIARGRYGPSILLDGAGRHGALFELSKADPAHPEGSRGTMNFWMATAVILDSIEARPRDPLEHDRDLFIPDEIEKRYGLLNYEEALTRRFLDPAPFDSSFLSLRGLDDFSGNRFDLLRETLIMHKPGKTDDFLMNMVAQKMMFAFSPAAGSVILEELGGFLVSEYAKSGELRSGAAQLGFLVEWLASVAHYQALMNHVQVASDDGRLAALVEEALQRIDVLSTAFEDGREDLALPSGATRTRYERTVRLAEWVLGRTTFAGHGGNPDRRPDIAPVPHPSDSSRLLRFADALEAVLSPETSPPDSVVDPIVWPPAASPERLVYSIVLPIGSDEDLYRAFRAVVAAVRHAHSQGADDVELHFEPGFGRQELQRLFTYFQRVYDAGDFGIQHSVNAGWPEPAARRLAWIANWWRAQDTVSDRIRALGNPFLTEFATIVAAAHAESNRRRSPGFSGDRPPLQDVGGAAETHGVVLRRFSVDAAKIQQVIDLAIYADAQIRALFAGRLRQAEDYGHAVLDAQRPIFVANALALGDALREIKTRSPGTAVIRFVTPVGLFRMFDLEGFRSFVFHQPVESRFHDDPVVEYLLRPGRIDEPGRKALFGLLALFFPMVRAALATRSLDVFTETRLAGDLLLGDTRAGGGEGAPVLDLEHARAIARLLYDQSRQSNAPDLGDPSASSWYGERIIAWIIGNRGSRLSPDTVWRVVESLPHANVTHLFQRPPMILDTKETLFRNDPTPGKGVLPSFGKWTAGLRAKGKNAQAEAHEDLTIPLIEEFLFAFLAYLLFGPVGLIVARVAHVLWHLRGPPWRYASARELFRHLVVPILISVVAFLLLTGFFPGLASLDSSALLTWRYWIEIVSPERLLAAAIVGTVFFLTHSPFNAGVGFLRWRYGWLIEKGVGGADNLAESGERNDRTDGDPAPLRWVIKGSSDFFEDYAHALLLDDARPVPNYEDYLAEQAELLARRAHEQVGENRPYRHDYSLTQNDAARIQEAGQTAFLLFEGDATVRPAAIFVPDGVYDEMLPRLDSMFAPGAEIIRVGGVASFGLRRLPFPDWRTAFAAYLFRSRANESRSILLRALPVDADWPIAPIAPAETIESVPVADDTVVVSPEERLRLFLATASESLDEFDAIIDRWTDQSFARLSPRATEREKIEIIRRRCDLWLDGFLGRPGGRSYFREIMRAESMLSERIFSEDFDRLASLAQRFERSLSRFVGAAAELDESDRSGHKPYLELYSQWRRNVLRVIGESMLDLPLPRRRRWLPFADTLFRLRLKFDLWLRKHIRVYRNRRKSPVLWTATSPWELRGTIMRVYEACADSLKKIGVNRNRENAAADALVNESTRFVLPRGFNAPAGNPSPMIQLELLGNDFETFIGSTQHKEISLLFAGIGFIPLEITQALHELFARLDKVGERSRRMEDPRPRDRCDPRAGRERH
jgi:hypothetical protein